MNIPTAESRINHRFEHSHHRDLRMGGQSQQLPAIEGQTYCLRWNNHKSNLVEILDALIKVESYVDCTIVVDDQVQFKAHRVVLAANSPYFQAILQDVPMDHCSIIFPGVKAFEMRALLEYMYTGEVNVTQSQIPKIMRIAEELEVKGLFDMADLKEKFNKLSEEHSDRGAVVGTNNPYGHTSIPPYPSAAATSSSAGATISHNGKDHTDSHHNNSSSVISTSSNISPSAAPSSSSSPPYNTYKSPYTNLYNKSPGPQTSTSTSAGSTAQQSGAQTSNTERGQWPLSPSTAAAMLSSVYESAPDMNPLKRKKLSSISSMLMNRDTPILRNVLAQANPADSSQPAMPLLLPSSGKNEKSSSEKNSSPHTSLSVAHNNNHSFNGSDYGSQDKKYPDEPHSPYTDRSFDDETYDPKGNYTSNYNSNSNQKPEWKRYKQYTRNDIMSAIQCVRDGMSALQASRKFGVPSRTLYDKVKKLGITTGRPMNRTMKRSPSNVESSAAFPYAHGYGQTEPLLSSMHERERDEREPKDHHRMEHHHIPPTIPHPAAALLDHAFLQQALENRSGEIAGREALHAMALAAAAHAAANRISTSPGPNGTTDRSPSPNFALKYSRQTEPDTMMEREKERRIIENEMERDNEMERERELERARELELDREQDESERERVRNEIEEDDDQVEDLSVSRKESISPAPSTTMRQRPESPYSPPPQHSTIIPTANGTGVIRSSSSSNSSKLNDDLINETSVKREVITDDNRAD